MARLLWKATAIAPLCNTPLKGEEKLEVFAKEAPVEATWRNRWDVTNST